MQQKLKQAKPGQEGQRQKWVGIGAVVVILGVGGYFGYGTLSEWRAKRSEAAKQASNTATQQVTNALPKPLRLHPAAPEKELPVLPPPGRSIVDKANIPDGKANGVISGTNFRRRNRHVHAPSVLRLFQGASASPDREILVYLHLNPGQSPTGHVWTVSQEMRDRSVPQVVKRWKTNPRYAPQSKAFSSGYAMKLELGEITNGVLPGKIFVALPDPEQSVVAGVFKATTTLADASGVGGAQPGRRAQPGRAPTPDRGPAASALRRQTLRPGTMVTGPPPGDWPLAASCDCPHSRGCTSQGIRCQWFNSVTWLANPVSSTRCCRASGGWTRPACKQSCNAWRANGPSSKRSSTPSRTASWSWMRRAASSTSTRR